MTVGVTQRGGRAAASPTATFDKGTVGVKTLTTQDFVEWVVAPLAGVTLGGVAGWFLTGGAGVATAGALVIGGQVLPVLPCLLTEHPEAVGLVTNCTLGAATIARVGPLTPGGALPLTSEALGVAAVILGTASLSLVLAVPLARAGRGGP